MTVEEIKKRVNLIKECSGDYEVAHSMEDRLHEEVLRVVANGAENARELAKEVLKTTEIDFDRYCA